MEREHICASVRECTGARSCAFVVVCHYGGTQRSFIVPARTGSGDDVVLTATVLTGAFVVVVVKSNETRNGF